jgi:hypothetical protein
MFRFPDLPVNELWENNRDSLPLKCQGLGAERLKHSPLFALDSSVKSKKYAGGTDDADGQEQVDWGQVPRAA